ncbi:MAG: histidine phosphatase family protein [Fibrobacter sp.]|nr:histidine phosphatase family protein [Fibrobacter sp.]
MSFKVAFSFLATFCGFFFIQSLCGCGDDSSTGNSPVIEAESPEDVSGLGASSSSTEDNAPGDSAHGQVAEISSSGTGVSRSSDSGTEGREPEPSSGSLPASTPGPAGPLSTSSTSVSSAAPSSSSVMPASSAEPSAPPALSQVTLDENGFATVADVYRSLAPDERAVFVIRHSEREDAVTMETELTANGIKMAQDLGKTLQGDEEFSYITSGFVRTNETANNISKGRGEASLPKLITNYDITGNWFLRTSADSLADYATQLGMKGSSVELMAHWAYGEPYPDVLRELDPRAEEFMQSVILKNLSKWKRVSIMVSHDIFVMPLTVYGSQRKVALKYHEDYHWINYIAGLAIIIDSNNGLRYIPVKGAESGVIDYLAIYMEQSGYGNTTGRKH